MKKSCRTRSSGQETGARRKANEAETGRARTEDPDQEQDQGRPEPEGGPRRRPTRATAGETTMIAGLRAAAPWSYNLPLGNTYIYIHCNP